MKYPILVPELRYLLRKKKLKILKSFMEDHHDNEIAEYLSMLRPDELWRIVDLVGIYQRAGIFSYMDMDVQVSMISGAHKKNVKSLLLQMSHDDRADLFQHLDKVMADRLLLLLPTKDRADIIRLTSYQEETCGAIMTTDFATLLEDDIVEKAIKKIRREAPGKETIYYIYVTDKEGRLIGFISLRKLIISKTKNKISDIMKRDTIFAFADEDQEKAANLIDEYDLIALPIVDRDEKLVGIITHDDAMDIIRDEQTEDMEKLMAISGGVEEKSYMGISAFIHFRKRASWIVILALLELLSGFIIEGFRATLQNLIILAYYMPLLISTGGNTGSQSATMVLRAIALNELSPKDTMGVIRKELAVSLMLSVCVAAIVCLRVFLMSHGSNDIPPALGLTRIAMMISLALAIQVIWSTVLGGIIPLVATRIKIDPAVVSSPAIATLVDVGGVLIYFSTAKLLLGI